MTTAQDHSALALAEVLSQFADSPKYRGIVSALAGRFRGIEDDAIALLDDGMISTAAGELLNRWGRLLAVSRGGRSDADYRRLILTRITARRSGGVPESILAVVAILAGDVAVRYTQIGTAAYQLEVQTTAPLTAQQKADIIEALEALSPAGVEYMAHEAGTDPAFEFEGGDGAGFDVGGLAGGIYP